MSPQRISSSLIYSHSYFRNSLFPLKESHIPSFLSMFIFAVPHIPSFHVDACLTTHSFQLDAPLTTPSFSPKTLNHSSSSPKPSSQPLFHQDSSLTFSHFIPFYKSPFHLTVFHNYPISPFPSQPSHFPVKLVTTLHFPFDNPHNHSQLPDNLIFHIKRNSQH